jgi:putative IMPACT (imprinted ancient) family translation regulator
VVRYFGGTLLGVPGLINAYRTTAALALQVTPPMQKQILSTYSLQFDYTQMNEVMKIVKQTDCLVISQETNLFCRVQVGIPRRRLEEILLKFKDLRDVELQKIA